MFLSPLNLVCVQYRRRLEGGVSRPLHVLGVDEKTGSRHEIVLKLRHPDTQDKSLDFEGTALACELICSMIAHAIGLPVPDYAVIRIPEELARSIKDENLRRLLQRNVGLNFGTIYQEGFRSWYPMQSDFLENEILSSLEGTFAFDATVINGDRKTSKPNLLWNGRKLFLIDHSIAIPVHCWADNDIDSSPLFPESEVKQHCIFGALKGMQFAFNSHMGKWQEKIKDTDLDDLRSIIPENWERRTGDLDKIFRFLKARPARFTDIQADLQRILR
jgi:hypothetical protein